MSERVVFLTGAGGFIGRWLLRRYLAEKETLLYLLEQGPQRDAVREYVAARISDAEYRERVHIVEGDIRKPDLGMEPRLFNEIRERLTLAIHLAAIYDLTVPRGIAEQVNIEGTRNILAFLSGARRLERFGHVSTCAISGTFQGRFQEDQFDVGQQFKNHYEYTKYESERLVRECRDSIPTTIFRPGYVVGDSRTGEFIKVDGPYFALVFIGRGRHFVVPNSKAKCNAPPVDFVAEAMYRLMDEPEAKGQVFHLVDPDPVTWTEYMYMAAERWGKMKPLLRVPPGWLIPLFRMPGFARFTGIPREAFEYTAFPVEYDTTNVTRVLAKAGVRCPHLSEYIDKMIDYFRENYRPS